ncbi:MAG: hypothetical protein RI538_07510, partial [Salibaculum sp.]|uniref:hypothetical protein n=1 Tax=Salibaculum sp. TaxID=2855480 RepID=UPI002870153E
NTCYTNKTRRFDLTSATFALSPFTFHILDVSKVPVGSAAATHEAIFLPTIQRKRLRFTGL